MKTVQQTPAKSPHKALTGGEVDSVVDRDGRTFLLRHVQEQLRDSEAARRSAILNALPAATFESLFLDPAGVDAATA